MSADGIVWDGDTAPASAAPTLRRPGAAAASPVASGIQWDSASTAPPAAPTLQNPQSRSLLRTAGDIGTSLGQGVESAGMFVPQLANTLTGGAVDKYGFKPLTGAVDSLLGGPGEGRTLAEASQDTRNALNTLKSPYLQQKDQELADTKGFLPTAKKILTTPSLLVEQATEQVPQLVAPGGIVRKAGAVAFERAAGSALARGVEKRIAAGMTEEAATKAATAAAERLGQRAAIKAGTKAAIGTEAAMSGSQNSEQAQQQVLGLDQKVLDANPDYQAMVARGVTPQDAREALAQQAGIRAGAAGAAITAATGGITGKLESKIFQGETGVHGFGQLLTGTGAKELAKAVGKETVQEGLQEGGEQFGQNLGVKSVDPNQSLMDQVPENAALGAVLGGTMGAGTFAGSAALSRPHHAGVPNPDAAPGSLSDAANVLTTPTGPLGRAADAAQVGGMRPNDAAAQAAGAPPLPGEAAASPVAESAPAEAAAPPAPAPAPNSVSLPWVNPQTGEVGTPSKGQLTIALADYIAQTYQAAGHMRINAGDVADAWGVPKAEINRVRNGATQLATRRIKSGEAAAPADMGNPISGQDQPVGAAAQTGTTASIPFMLTNGMKAELRALGHTDADISAMTPEQAHAILRAGESVLGGARDLLGHTGPAADTAIDQAAADSQATDTGATDGHERVSSPAAGETPAAGAAPASQADAESAANVDHGTAAGAGEPSAAVPAAVAGERHATDTHPAVAKEPTGVEKPDNVPSQPAAQGNGVDSAAGRAGGESQGGAEATGTGQAPAQEATAPRARVPAAETVEPAPAVAAPHKVSAAARDAEGLRIKTADGETNGRSHVDGLITAGFTKVESHNNGKTMQHTMVNAAGERAPIKARQLKYAKEASTNHADTARKQIDVAAHEAATSPHNDTPAAGKTKGEQATERVSKLKQQLQRARREGKDTAAIEAEIRSQRQNVFDETPAEDASSAKAAPAAPAKWFGDREKAQKYLAKQKLAGTHEIVQVGKRFEIHQRQSTSAESALSNPVHAALQAAVSVDHLSSAELDQVSAILDRGEANLKGKPAEKSDTRFANNTIFTADKVAAARDRLKSKLGTVSAGIDPEVLLDGLTIAGAYIESGARSFSAYAKAMIDDLGDGVRPFLRSFYESVRHYPGFDAAGMSTPAEAERLHAQLTAGSESHPAIGEKPQPAARKPATARKAGAPIDRTLTQDWGVAHIDGHTALPGKPFADADYSDFGMKNGVKDAFLKESKSYLQAVSEALIRDGYREYPGKARAVTVNEGGQAVSGEVSLVLQKPGAAGVYVHVSASALRGMVPSSKQGISVLFRAAPEGDKYGTKGVNQWAPADLTAGELADLIKTQLNRSAATATKAATDEHPAATASRAESARPAVGGEDSQGSAPAGKGQLGASQSGPAQADLADLGAKQPADAGAAQGSQPELSGRSGARAAGTDVGHAEGADRNRDGSDGRARAGGTRNADARSGEPDGSGRAGGSAGRDARQRAALANPEVVKPPAEVSPANPGAGNYHMADPLAVVGGGAVARFNKNQASIELYNTLRDESRKPTAEEQAVLAGYTGWGSFGQELFQGNWGRPAPKDGWQARDKWLRENLGQSEWESVQRSITNAHYTDPPTVMAMWKMVQRMGFTGGRVLEPSMGIGNFFAMMPRELADRSKLSGIELDEVTGGMAKLLYPDANVHVMGYQDSKTPDSFHDVIIGNWPFENTPVPDRRYQRLNPMVHDYFFLKALDQVRPGGLVVGITSKGTMDKKAVGIRAELARKGELVAAYRLPSGAFEEYAGTSVVTDIVILRKRAEPIGNPMGEGWIDAKEYMTPQGEPVFLNEYYHAHPENVIGTIEYGHGTTQGRAGMIVTRPADMQAQLERIVASVPAGAYRADTRADHISYVTNHTKDREGSLTASAGKFYVVRGEQMAPAEQVRKYSGSSKAETSAREDQLNRLIGMRQQYAALITAERTKGADATAARKALKASYDRFVKDHGQLNQSFGLDYLRRIDDPFYYSLAALEIHTGGRGKTAKYRPAQILTESTTRASAVVKNPTITDAFVIARNRTVNPTLDEIASISGKSADQVRAELIGKGTIYELPGGDIVPADIYLSGNVREKLRQARAAVEVEGNTALQRNVDALEKVVPADIPYYKIETQFGATWVSIDNYKAYIAHMLGADTTNGIDVSYNAGRWRVQLDDKLKSRPEYRANFGTMHTGFRALVQAAISNQTITIRSKDREGNLVADPEKTKEVTEKIANIRSQFGDWLWSDPERKVAAEREYNEVRNAYATPHFDGSFLGLEGMALSLGRGPFDLREHQRNAIWRALVTRKSLNAHEVGTGKTFTMGGIAVESRRYGIAKKPLLLAHNANSKSVASEIQQMYPAAKVLYIDNLAPDAIDVKLRQIANDDWDTIVMPHSLIDRLSFTEETLMAMAKEEIAELEQAAADAAEDDGTTLTPAMLDDEEALKKLRSPTAKELVKMRNRIIATIKKQALRSSREGAISFEDLGIDQLLVDEAHEFKKPPFSTKMKMKGLQTQASDKAIALNFMSKYVRGNNNGGNVHLFTGTPVTNTMTEVFHMMRYIMQEEMQSAGVDQWDGWFGSFAREVQDVELNAAAEYEAVTRLAAFINVPELRRMIGQYMDVVFSDDMPEMQPRRTASGKTMADALDPREQAELMNGRTEGAQDRPYKKVVIDTADLTPAQASAFEQIQGFAKGWRNFSKKERKAAMLAGAPESPIIYEGLANKASLDSRLLHGEALAGQEGKARDDAGSKASRVVKNVLEIYHSHPQANQVIFSDLGMGTVATRSVGEVGKKTQQRYKVFSTLRDVIERLAAGGIPREQIALVDGSTSKEKRKEIADKVNTGEIRVVIGSSGSLGVGVNMQRNLRAMHHMDAPWMPGDLEQRNGRGQRQGNQWNTVLEYRYLTDRLDGRRWQVLAIKDRFIKSFLKANDSDRVIEGDAASDEQSDILQTFSEAAGDPRVLIREKIKKKIEALQSKERLHGRAMADNQASIRRLSAAADTRSNQLAGAARDGVEEKVAAIVADNAGSNFRMKVDGKTFDKRSDADEAIKEWVNKNVSTGQRRVTIGEYGGHRLFVRWGSLDEKPTLSMEFGDTVVEGQAGTVTSMDMALRNLPTKLQKQRDDLAATEQSLARMKKTVGEPFHMADQLAAQQKALTDLERDIEVNPVPPPAWLRQGAPVDTETFWKGKPYTVTGHRWTNDGWYVMGEGPKGEVQIPYTEAKDSQGIPQYDERPFQSPKVLTEAERKAAEDNTPPAPVAQFSKDEAASTERATPAQEAHTARIQQIATAAMGKWKGDDVPALRVVATPEQLPAMARRDANGQPSNAYKNAAGMYDGKTIYIVASKHTNDAAGMRKLLTTMAHEGVGHYGVNRIVNRELGADAWTKIQNATERLRNNPKLASPAIREVLANVEARYRIDGERASPQLFAEEFLAVSAERGVKNGLLDRAITAIRQWLRKVLPDLSLSEHELRQLLVQSDQYLSRGQSYQQRVQTVAAMSFSKGVEPTLDTPAFKRWFGDSKVVDASGGPLPVYHGTADDFDAFDPKRSGSATAHMTANLGTFFAEDRAKAQHYAENASGGVPAEERVVDAYLSIQKPYEMGLKQFMGLDSQEESEALRNKLIGQGYDGIHIKGANQWIAFTPTQIKSASENRGTFDPGNPNIYFSRDENADPDNPAKPKRSFTDASASIEAIHDQLPQLDRSAFQQVKDWISGKARDLEPLALGALQLRHVLELASEDPTLKGPAQAYANTYQRMDGDRNTLTIDGAAKVDALVKWARQPGVAGWMGKVSEDAKRLFHFMHAVTQLAVDPTNQYERLLMRDAGNEYKPWTKELIKQRVKILREVALTRSGDDKTRIYDEIKDLQRLPQREKVREQKYPELVRQWNALTPEAKKQFQVMRDHYREQSEALEEATLAHIASLDIPEQNRRAAAALVNRNFAEAKVDGVYFPLSRFGDYWISATTKDGEYVFAKYESANQMQQAEKRFLASGAHIEARGRQDNNYKAKDAPSGTFIGDLMGVLKNAPDKVKDEIYQMYLKALPNLSLRKHGIHRKNIAGYTDDVPRAFAGSVFHGAHQISKARYGWQLTNTLEQMRERMEARRTVVTGTAAAHADALIGEINRRHDWILNPTNNALSNKLTGVAFTYFLGASPASAIVNLIQVPQIVLPVLGAQHGWPRATTVLGRAMKQAIGTGGHIDKVLTGEELEAYRALEKQGTFQRSATHALAGISEGDNLRSSPAYTKVMNAVSWMFHTSEVINREATGMAAFRLAREKGQKFEEAVRYADQMTNGTHGDYSNANRARYMQGNVTKVAFQFKNYSLAMSWLWGRNFYNAFKGEDAATRTLARRTLTGLLGMTGLFAGVIGMPIFNLLRYGAQAVHAASGDDDEPWDFVTEFRSWLAEHLGETAASVIADGAASQLGANVASRVSMSDLWFRDADKQLEGEDAYNNMLQSIAGPLGGLIKNMYVGAQQFSDGHTERGIETMLPTFAKNAVKAARFASQGVNTLRGDPIVSDVTAPQAVIQAIGFQPTKVADQQRINNALFNYQKFIQDRRQQLMNAFAMAQQAGDDDGRAATLTKIQSFNQKYPEIAIRMSNLHASMRQRARFSAEADNGIRLNKKLASRVREEVGALAQE